MTTNEFISIIANGAQIPLKSAKAVWANVVDAVAKDLKKNGEVKIPEIAKLIIKKVPARKACTKMVLGQMRDLPAKPASKKVKARLLKAFTTKVV